MSKEFLDADSSGHDEHKSGWRVVKMVIPYLWPRDNWEIKTRVVLALISLFVAKTLGVVSPLLQAQAVDNLSSNGVSDLMLGDRKSVV